MYSVLASGFYLTICVSLHGRTFKIVQAAFEIRKLSTLLLSIPLASFAAAAHRNCPTTFHKGSFIKVSPAEPVTTSLRNTEKLRIWQTGWSSTCSSQKEFLSSSHPLRNFFGHWPRGGSPPSACSRNSWIEPHGWHMMSIFFWRDLEVYNLTKQLSSSFGKLFFSPHLLILPSWWCTLVTHIVWITKKLSKKLACAKYLSCKGQNMV